MRKDLEQEFQKRWPSWFNLDGALECKHRSMAFEFEDGGCWFDLVWRLCEQIEPIVLVGQAETFEGDALLDATSNPPFEVHQVKEKFSGLQFYRNSRSQTIYDQIEQAGKRSLHVCDICGQPGSVRTDPGGMGWHRTKCDQHIDTRQQY